MFQWAVLRRSRLVPTSADLVHLQDVRIASPCTSDWSKMTGDDRVRHCAECNLNVYNFAAMTGFEIAELLANRQGRRVCARIYRRADGTMITQDCPKGLRAVIRRVSRVAGAAFAAAMSLGFATAQTPSQASAPQQQKKGESSPMAVDPAKAESVNLGVVVEADAPPIETMPIDVTNNLPAAWKAGPSGPVQPPRKLQAKPGRQ